MASSVFQGLEPCPEPGEASTEPNVSWLKLVRPIMSNDRNPSSFIDPTSTHKNTQDNVYVHPLVKSSTSLLSKKSLEMCTESLGSETGTEVIDMSSLESTRKNTSPKKNMRNRMTTTTANRRKKFPPPMTTISGSSSGEIKVVRSHREGGRLVLQAVSVAPLQSCFHAERSEGRLKLSFIEKS